MVAFSEAVIQQIKAAATEDHVLKIIDASLVHFRTARSAHSESRYIMNMIVSLQVTRLEQLAPAERSNIKLAIEIFRRYQRTNPGALF